MARLRFVKQAMDGLKESKQAVGAATLAAVNNLAPPTILAQASRLNFSTRLFNLIVTNIPGPQLPLYVLGRQLDDLFPIAFLPKDHALAIAIMSYNGGSTTGCSATTTRCRTSTWSPRGSTPRSRELLEAAQAALSRRPARRGQRRGNGGPRRLATPSHAATAARRRSCHRRAHGASADPRPTCAPSASPRPGSSASAPSPETAHDSDSERSRWPDDLIQPDEIAFRLELTAAQLKIVHTALKSLYDDLGHEEADVKQVVAAVLDKLPGEHEIRAIDLDHELGADSGAI